MALRVTALVGSETQPSSRFRVHQHLPALAARGVEVREVRPRIDRHAQLLPPRWEGHRAVRWPTRAVMHGIKVLSRAPDALATWQGDLTWVQREMVPGIPSWEPLLKRPMVLDVDDAIWLSPPAGALMARTLAREARVVVAGNTYLADWFARAARDVRIVPTAVDTERFVPAPSGDGPPVVGWVGTASNLPFLEAIEPVLARVLAAVPDARLRVVSNRAPRFATLPADRVEYIAWTPEGEVSCFQGLTVGLMPLEDDPWTRGKCAFKMLQYMACGAAVVVSPVGMNADVLAMASVGHAARNIAQWEEATVALLRDPAGAAQMGAEGRRVVEEHFSARVVAQRLADIFYEVSGASPTP